MRLYTPRNSQSLEPRYFARCNWVRILEHLAPSPVGSAQLFLRTMQKRVTHLQENVPLHSSELDPRICSFV